MSKFHSHFVAHKQQAARMVGAHQRPIVGVKSPTAVRHLALWQGYEVDKAEVPPSRFGPEDHYIACCFRKLLALRMRRKIEFRYPSGFVDPNSRSFIGKHDTIQLFSSHICASKGKVVAVDSGDIQVGVPWRTIRFDLVWNGLPITITFDSHVEHLLITTYAHLNEVAEGSKLWPKSDPLRPAQWRGIRSLNEDTCEFVYHSLWEAIDDLLLPDSPADGVGKVIADSRGLMINPHVPDIHGRRHDLGASEAELLRECWSSVYPHAGVGPDVQRNEFTISALMNNGALHATSLGHHSPSGTQQLPMRYIIAEHLENDSQRGRLLYRINRAGIARICATMHWEHLNIIGRHLRVAEARLAEGLYHQRRVLQRTEHVREPANAGGGVVPPEALAAETGSPCAFPARLARWWSTKKKIWGDYSQVKRDAERESVLDDYNLDDLKTVLAECEMQMSAADAQEIGGGVAYRSERSRQYVDEFNRVVADLRLGRIDGYQRYDEYVRQRLGSAFDYIGTIGDRYLRVQNGIAQMRDRQRSYDTINIARGIDKAQDTADIALFAVIGPYYAAQVITKQLHVDHGWVYEAVWLLAGLAGTMIALRKWSHRNGIGMKKAFRDWLPWHMAWLASAGVLSLIWLARHVIPWITTHLLPSVAGMIAAVLTFSH